ncbi:MAG TPA: hypothetical protein VK766_01405 [Cytophagaceae bacterium]|jgi:cytochrome c oxidase cbb3-type subunit 4|nr:hypothetical protein [Cytophagaceae bacterium]
MLKYIKNHLANISGIEIYPIISFIIFFLFFLVIILWILKGDKKYFNTMSNLPLDQNNLNSES